MDVRQYLKARKEQVDAALEILLPVAGGTLAKHVKAMRYSLFAGGKRVRPILCLAAAEAVKDYDNSFPEPLLLTACSLECIHTYSLIHDDLPAMDDDDLRRGKPTNHVVFGEAGAILAGDSLLSYAFELLSSNDFETVPPADRLHVISIVSKAVGPEGMVGGQFLDLTHAGKEVTYDLLREIHSRKKGALITASVQAGAVLANCTPEQFDALTLFGNRIGLAFQIVDDLLNVEGTTEQLGKAAGSDVAMLKATYPALFGIGKTRGKAREALADALKALEGFDLKADMLRELAKYIVTRNR
jgi:geranylgeranyl diphosphate synthase type II